MSDWSDEMAEILNKRQRTQEAQASQKIEKEKIIAQQGPLLWAEFKDKIKKNCDDLNARMKKQILVCEVTPSSEIRVRANLDKGTSWLRVEFVPEKGLSWDANTRMGCSGQCSMSVDEVGKVQFYEGSWVPSSPESLANRLLRSLLE